MSRRDSLSGTGSRFITYEVPNTGTDNATFVPNVAVPGKYEVFDTPEDKKVAESKLLTKRAALEKTARQLAASGVEFNDSELPRSFRTELDPAGEEGTAQLSS